MMEFEQISIGSDSAIKMSETKWWEKASPEEIVSHQLFVAELCMPFDEFHKAVEIVLDRPVWTHEFAFADKLASEYLGKKQPPTMEEIVNLIPDCKRIIIGID